MDIIDNKDNIVNNLNNIVTTYVELDSKYNKISNELCEVNKKTNQTLKKLNISLDEKDKIISKLNRDKVEYEKIINGLNDKIESLLKEKKSEDRHSILVNQANQLEEKDRVIEHLQNKLSKYLDKVKIDDSIKIFTDGACSNNGKKNAKAGIGVYYGENDIRNVSERIDGSQTNNMAELRAIIKVFDSCEGIIKSGKKITIYSDSKIAIGWCTTTGKKYEISNWDSNALNKIDADKIIYIKNAYELFQKYNNVKLEYVKAHTDNMDELSIGNRKADKLATNSLKLDDIITDDIHTIVNDECNSKHSLININNNDISEIIIDADNNDKQTKSKMKNDSDLSDDDDEVWIKVKYKKQSYYIVRNETPQYIYSIVDNKKGDRLGHREMVITNDKKKYKYRFD